MSAAEPRSYHGQPVIKEPVWTWEIPTYFFTGGMGGAGAGLAYLAGLRGNETLARRGWAVALGGVAVSPAFLISDLGKPVRFLNMLRMFKVTSPMSVGSWVLAGSGATTAVAAVNAWTGLLPRTARVARPAAALLGLPLSTYTAALIANTAVPVWHEARRELPFVFAAGAALSAGAATAAITPPAQAAPARRLAVGGAALELILKEVMEKRLGEHEGPYEEGLPKQATRLTRACTLAGGTLLATRGARSRGAAAARRAGAVHGRARRPVEHLQGRIPVRLQPRLRRRAAARRDRPGRAPWRRAAGGAGRCGRSGERLAGEQRDTAGAVGERRKREPPVSQDRAPALISTRQQYDHLFHIYLPIAIGVFGLIVVVTLIVVLIYRRRPRERAARWHEHNPLEGTYAVLLACTAAFLLYLTFGAEHKVDTVANQERPAVVIDVDGLQVGVDAVLSGLCVQRAQRHRRAPAIRGSRGRGDPLQPQLRGRDPLVLDPCPPLQARRDTGLAPGDHAHLHQSWRVHRAVR